MTLCVAWRTDNNVHFASDSRISFASKSYADVGIKVLSIPYNLYSPSPERNLDFSGELGMCFAGSAVNSFVIKESILEILKDIQYAPGYSDISMDALSQLVFATYREISKLVCETSIGGNGRAALIIAGWCNEKNCIRSFLMLTSDQNVHSCEEVLSEQNKHIFIGNADAKAEHLLTKNPTNSDYLYTLKNIIDDDSVPGVGGHIQYGNFNGKHFKVYGITEFDQLAGKVHYWRGALDINSDDFMNSKRSLVPGLPYIDPFQTFADTN